MTIEEAYAKVCEAGKEFVVPDKAHCGATLHYMSYAFNAENENPHIRWEVNFQFSGHTIVEHGEKFAEVLAKAVTRARWDYAVKRCSICGGRMDGPCKHSH